jgi:hypothetical protein
MDKWLKDILPDKEPYHNRGRDQMRKKGGSGIRVPVLLTVRADEEVSLTETKRIRLLADYIQETKRLDI